MKPELAVFGGSFDPPHVGHLFLAAYALSVGGVAGVVVAPTFQHAFGKSLTEFDHRLRMCELAFAPLRGIEVSPIERELGGTSRTLRLVSALSDQHPGHALRLLIGADILLEAQRWDRFADICALAPPLVVGRTGYADVTDSAALKLPEVSSSALRTALAQADDVTHHLPRTVHAYLTEHALYCAKSFA